MTFHKHVFCKKIAVFLFFSEDLVDYTHSKQVVHVSDRGTIIGLLQQTNLYGTGSGIVKQPENQGLAFLPLIDEPKGEIILIKKKKRQISPIGDRFLQKLRHHIASFHSNV